MKRLIILLIVGLSFAKAHFLTFLPSTDNIEINEEANLSFDAMFIHPFEQKGMTMEKPEGIFYKNKKLPLIETKKLGFKSWQTNYKVKRPGVYQFYVKPQAYFEPAEEKFIVHVPKVIVSAYGFENGWDEPIGLKYEIVPLVKPFGLYSGNLFQGKVLYNGEAISNVEVEVEFFNEIGLKAPKNSHITQVIKTDENGVFSFVMNQKGWWGFAALIEDGQKEYKGNKYPIENGALLWIKAY